MHYICPPGSGWRDVFQFMVSRYALILLSTFLSLSAAAGFPAEQQACSQLTGDVVDAHGSAFAGAEVTLRSETTRKLISVKTDSRGQFDAGAVEQGTYLISLQSQGRQLSSDAHFLVTETNGMACRLRLVADGNHLTVHHGPGGQNPSSGQAGGQAASAASPDPAAAKGTGGETLSSKEVSGLPLNKRDFSQLLLLAAGTMTDANGAANFTQQFAVNGQRGATTIFAMDGVDTTDPEMGGSTFSNFNVDAIQEIESSSGVMPAEIGHGAAGFTNIVTKSGTDQIHGSVFEFVRNAAFDARNFFDRKTIADPRRIPPFIRNEFGFTIGGPVQLPFVYRGRKRTYFFGQYQGFRQILGTTQVISVPTPQEREGLNMSAFPGDTLMVPVDPQIRAILARYPLPNDPQGAYGPRTYATSSKVTTNSNQFSVRLDHAISDKAILFARFSLNDVDGPLTNPSQTAIDPTFAIRFYDRQRNIGLRYTRTQSSHFAWDASLGYIRSTPMFPAINHTQPALMFGDGLYEPFNSADGSLMGAFGNLYQGRLNFTYARGSHSIKWGGEVRLNRDVTVFGTNPNGAYTFGGGTAYANAAIPSASGKHNLRPGDALPDALSGLLTATPFSYTVHVASSLVGQGDRFNEAGERREAYNVYFQDTWKITPRLTLNYGLRYEYNTPIKEVKNRIALPVIVGQDGQPASYWKKGAYQKFLVNPSPAYDRDWSGWGPRLSGAWAVSDHTTLRLGGAISSLLTNLWQDNFVSGGIPFAFSLYVSALPNVAVPFQNSVPQITLPSVYTPGGNLVYPNGDTMAAAPNTEVDLLRFQRDLAALSPGGEVSALTGFGMVPNFRNGYVGSYTAGIEQHVGDVTLSAAYVATTGVHLSSVLYPNSYGGADSAFAPFTKFDAAGRVIGGFGPELLMSSGSHSSYHALQIAAEKTSARYGLGFQSSYTLSKSLDDTSAAVGGVFVGSGAVLQTSPQNPHDPGTEKGASTFDTTHVFTLSFIQVLPFDRLDALRILSRKLTSGWQILNITTLTSGPPFTVFSGVQQTGVGSNGADRPDQAGQPAFSTSRNIREDYFGLGSDNASYFSIPVGVPGGTGPNQGRFGTLGRSTFRGPGFHNFDVAIIKDTPLGRRGGTEALTLEFRAEFFNLFNLVNFSLPSNIVRGSGFGIINRTSGPSRQIQFSLKLIY